MPLRWWTLYELRSDAGHMAATPEFINKNPQAGGGILEELARSRQGVQAESVESGDVIYGFFTPQGFIP